MMGADRGRPIALVFWGKCGQESLRTRVHGGRRRQNSPRIAAQSKKYQPSMCSISAIASRMPGPTVLYQREQGSEAEALVQSAMPSAVILAAFAFCFSELRSVLNRFSPEWRRFSPFLPVVGADTRFQPVYVDDVAAAAELALTTRVAPGIYELGGPDVATFRELMVQIAAWIRRNRVLLNVPFFAAKIMGTSFDILQKISFGLFTNGVLTRDQVRQPCP